MYDLLDDSDNLIFGNGIYEGDVSNIAKLMADKIIPDFEDSSGETPSEQHYIEATDTEEQIITDKQRVKVAIISCLLSIDSPTPDLIVDALPNESENFVRYLLELYQDLNYTKGYMTTNTWDAFVADIKSCTVEQLLART